MTSNLQMNIFNDNGVLKRNYRGTVTTFGTENPFNQSLNTGNAVQFATVQTPSIKSASGFTHNVPDSSNDAVVTTDASQTFLAKTFQTELNTFTPLIGALRKASFQTIPSESYTLVKDWSAAGDNTVGGTPIVELDNHRMRLMKRGLWRFDVSCSFAANSDRDRAVSVRWDPDGSGPDFSNDMFGGECNVAAAMGVTTVNYSCYYYTDTTKSRVYLFAWQNSGADLDIGSATVQNQILFRATYVCADPL